MAARVTSAIAGSSIVERTLDLEHDPFDLGERREASADRKRVDRYTNAAPFGGRTAAE